MLEYLCDFVDVLRIFRDVELEILLFCLLLDSNWFFDIFDNCDDEIFNELMEFVSLGVFVFLFWWKIFLIMVIDKYL